MRAGYGQGEGDFEGVLEAAGLRAGAGLAAEPYSVHLDLHSLHFRDCCGVGKVMLSLSQCVAAYP
eukprot:1134237-Pelagomonas_calceolata.AAC.3